jgi:AraC-like DNA-binding protein
MDNIIVLLYIYTMTHDETLSDQAFLRLVQQSLSWEYLGGVHSGNCCHPMTDWRLLPFLVVVCPMKGEYQSNIKQRGLVKISPGNVLLVPAGITHTVGMPRPGVVHYAHIRYTIFNSMDILQFFEVPWVVEGKVGREIARITGDLHVAMEEHSAGELAVAQAVCRYELSSRLLGLIVSASKPRPVGTPLFLDIPRIEPVFRYVEENISQPITRGELAKRAFLSETRFHYVFKNIMGLSPMAYVKSVRMHKAQTLLSQSRLSITQVGEKVGYPDIFHFSKIFKKTFGVSPLNYREKLQQWFIASSF